MSARWSPLIAVVGVFALCFYAVQGPEQSGQAGQGQPDAVASEASPPSSDPAVRNIDLWFQQRWADESLVPAEPASDLQILRRLALALMGTLPSLEEIRQFESEPPAGRLERWTDRWLADPRFADYFAERLARSYVGIEGGQFIIFRRDRFVSWLSEQLREGVPYDRMVEQMIASNGLWTGEPQTNFVTSAYANDVLDPNKLAARSARAFLGQSMDCAQCHDHFFADWKQHHFEGIAAHFARARISPLGVFEDASQSFKVQDRKTLEDRVVSPAVPFHGEWKPDDGTSRNQFSKWLTHEKNRRFERAIANRVWGLMFGRPFIAPVDDMPNPPAAESSDVLDLLGGEFRQAGCDLRRMVRLIAASRAFRLQSRHDSQDPSLVKSLEESWGVFPLTRLRPEQVIGAMLQAASIQTIDQNSHLFVRTTRFFRERDFVEAYGDPGAKELDQQPGTIPQALLLMNSDMTRDTVKIDPISASNRVAGMCATDQAAIETAFLICLTRRPDATERTHFESQLAPPKESSTDKTSESSSNDTPAKRPRRPRGDDRQAVIEDLFWGLFNSHEFSWNH